VNFGAVTSDIAFLICIPSYSYKAKTGPRSPFVALIKMSMGTFKAAIMDVYISCKFGGLLSSTSVVNAAQLCTAGIDQHSVGAGVQRSGPSPPSHGQDDSCEIRINPLTFSW